jgi:hypothetical protein
MIRKILAIEFKPIDEMDLKGMEDFIDQCKLNIEIDEFKELEKYLLGTPQSTLSFLPKLDETELMPDDLSYFMKYVNLEQLKKHTESTDYVIQTDIIKNKFPDIEIDNDNHFWNKLHQFMVQFLSTVHCEYIKTYLKNVIDVLEYNCIERSLQHMLSTTGTEWDGWYYKLFYRKSDIHDRCCDIKNIRMIVKYFNDIEANYILPSRKQKNQNKCAINFSK